MVAEELVQDTFLAVWQSATSYAPQTGPVRGWLFSIIYHHTVDYLRSMRRRSTLQQVKWQEVEAYERFALSDVWEEAWSSVQIAELHACLKQLPTEQRTVIELAYFERMDTLQRSPNAVKFPSVPSKRVYAWGYVTSGKHLSKKELEKLLASNKNSGDAQI